MTLEVLDPRWARNVAFDMEALDLTDSRDVVDFLLHAVAEGVASGQLLLVPARKGPLRMFIKK